MSIYAPDPRIKKRRDAWLAVLIVSVFSAFCLGAAFALSVEPRLVLERIEPRSFRGTGSNHCFGHQFYSKTVDEISQVVLGSAARDRASDSIAERQRRARQKHLDLYGAKRGRLGWDLLNDQRIIEDFMRGEEPRLALANPPPLWRQIIAWFFAGFGALIFVGAIQGNFFPKAKAPSPQS